MKLQRVRIINFRSLNDVTMWFDPVTSLIGPNGVGKSSVLLALDWFFNKGQSERLDSADCCWGHEGEDVVVEVELCSLLAADRDQLGKYAQPEVDSFVARKVRTPDGRERLTANAMGYGPFTTVRQGANATAQRAAYKELRAEHPELELPSANSAQAVEDAMRAWELAHPNDLTQMPEELTTNFFGFNSQGKMSGLFDYVLISADLRATEEVADNRSSVIGRILARAIDRAAADEELAALTLDVQRRQNEIFERTFRPQMNSISAELSAAVGQYADGRTVALTIDEVETKAPKTVFGVVVDDSGVETTIGRQGHGFQRTLLVAALQLLAQRGTNQDSGTICLAIEEPELFQHPPQARAFAGVLRRLAEQVDSGVQVVYATHSPYFIEAGHIEQVRRFSRAPREGGGESISVSSLSLDALKERLQGYLQNDTVGNRAEAFSLSKLPEALFSRRAVLVEGTSDQAVLEGFAERDNDAPLSVSGISVAAVGGKDNLYLAAAVLEQFGVPTFVLYDGDGGIAARMRAKGKSQADIDACVAKTAVQNRKMLRFLGRDEIDWPSSEISDVHAVIEDELETLLRSEWSEWVQTLERLVEESGVDPQKNALAYRRVTAEAPGRPPVFVSEVMKKIRTF